MRTEDAIVRPLLRIRDVAARGGLYGLAAVPLLRVASLFVGDHYDRRTFLAVVARLVLVLDRNAPSLTSVPSSRRYTWAWDLHSPVRALYRARAAMPRRAGRRAGGQARCQGEIQQLLHQPFRRGLQKPSTGALWCENVDHGEDGSLTSIITARVAAHETATTAPAPALGSSVAAVLRTGHDGRRPHHDGLGPCPFVDRFCRCPARGAVECLAGGVRRLASSRAACTNRTAQDPEERRVPCGQGHRSADRPTP
ncbi:DUF6336 family protein [Streptomyces coeruleorubidus]|uniref:DUF6336 family protein n=1 Tax=Streptomyces coeruleorubidus TaxID=116188 RepID=UPI0036630798